MRWFPLLALSLAACPQGTIDDNDPCAPTDLAVSATVLWEDPCSFVEDVSEAVEWAQYRICETPAGLLLEMNHGGSDERAWTRFFEWPGELVAIRTHDDNPQGGTCPTGTWSGLHPDDVECTATVETGTCDLANDTDEDASPVLPDTDVEADTDTPTADSDTDMPSGDSDTDLDASTDTGDTDLVADTDVAPDTADTDAVLDTADTDVALDTADTADTAPVHTADTAPSGTLCSSIAGTSALGGPADLHGFCWYIGAGNSTCDQVCAELGGANLAVQAENSFPDSCNAPSSTDVSTWFATQGGNPAGWDRAGAGTGGHTLGYGYVGERYYGKCASGGSPVGTYPGEINTPPPPLQLTPICPCFVASP